jgi:hypothetical protein
MAERWGEKEHREEMRRERKGNEILKDEMWVR